MAREKPGGGGFHPPPAEIGLSKLKSKGVARYALPGSPEKPTNDEGSPKVLRKPIKISK